MIKVSFPIPRPVGFISGVIYSLLRLKELSNYPRNRSSGVMVNYCDQGDHDKDNDVRVVSPCCWIGSYFWCRHLLSFPFSLLAEDDDHQEEADNDDQGDIVNKEIPNHPPDIPLFFINHCLLLC
jgi:hypothetical protein